MASLATTIPNYKGQLVEGIKYDSRNNLVLWVDIKKAEIHRVVNGNHQVISLNSAKESVGFIALTTSVDTVLACAKYGVGVANFITGNFEYRFRYPDDMTLLRSNDGIVDEYGNLWIGTMSDFGYDVAPRGKLYRITPGGSCEVAIADVLIPNGIAIRNNKFYFTDSKNHRILEYHYDGHISHPRVFIDLKPRYGNGEPDGCAWDESGLYVAVWGTSKVAHFDWNGDFVTEWQLPAKRVSCVGGKGYVTTASPTVEGEAVGDDQGGHIYQLPVSIDQKYWYWGL